MAIFEISSDAIRPLGQTCFADAGLKERNDLQRLLRDQVRVVASDCLVIAEEFGQWTESRRRVDLLAVDKQGCLVVIELKRTDDGGHMELQALRYAAMVSTLTAERAVDIYGEYLKSRGSEEDPTQALVDFLEWDDLDEERFGQDVRIVLVSADFSRELTTAVMWLNEKDLDIRCVRIRPYAYEGRTLIDVQQVIPLPEASDYQIGIREKKRQERKQRSSKRDFRPYDISIQGEVHAGLWKRHAILLVVRALQDLGATPEEITTALAPLGRTRLWAVVDGELGSEAFLEVASRQAAANGSRFRPGRWHTEDGDLFHHDGRTYAFSNQWGRQWDRCMRQLGERFPDLQLGWRPSEEVEDQGDV